MAEKILFLVAATLAPYILADHIYRPCPLDDYQCIGEVLQANSLCNVESVRGYIKQEFVLPELLFDTPFFNSSYTDKFLIIRNLNLCIVSECYINRLTGVIVIGVDCPHVDEEATRYLYQHKSLQEDSSYNFNFRGIYPLIRMTTVMQANDMDICKARVFTEVLGLPNLNVRPNDQPTANFLTQDLSLLNIYEIENYYCRGPAYFRGFMKSMICQYPCEVAPGIPELP